MELNLYLLGVFTLSVDSFCPYSIDIDLICANAPIWLHIFNKSSVLGCISHMHQVGVWLFGFIASRKLNCCYEYVICCSSIKIWQTQQKPWNVFNMFYKLMEGKHCLPVTSHLWCQKLTLKFSDAWFWFRCSLLIILLYIYLILLNAFLNRFARAYHLRGLLFHGMGEHRYILWTFDNLWKGTLWIQCYYLSSHDPVDHLGSLRIYGGRGWWIMWGNKLSCEKGNKLSCEKGKWEIKSNMPTCDLVS